MRTQRDTNLCAGSPSCMRQACIGSSLLTRVQHSLKQRVPHVWRSSQQRRGWRWRPVAATAATMGSSEDGEFRTLAQPHSLQLVVKASRFLATAWPVSSTAEVLPIRPTAFREPSGLSTLQVAETDRRVKVDVSCAMKC